jgi:hypothetical protein
MTWATPNRIKADTKEETSTGRATSAPAAPVHAMGLLGLALSVWAIAVALSRL